MLLCDHCHSSPVPKRHRKYCADCSRLASAIWKRQHRRLWAQRWRDRRDSEVPPWMDGWESMDDYRQYRREYMRQWRERRRKRRKEAKEA